MNPKISRLLLLLLILVGTAGCDQTTKHFARTALAGQSTIQLPSGIGELVLAQNLGGHLSLGASWPKAVRQACFIFVVGAFLLAPASFLVWKTKLGTLQFGCLSFALAGGSSNLIDRIRQDGAVTDFIYLHVGWLHTGIFNLADVVLELAIAGLLISAVHTLRSERKKPSPNA